MTKYEREVLQLLKEIKATLETLRVNQFTYTVPPTTQPWGGTPKYPYICVNSEVK